MCQSQDSGLGEEIQQQRVISQWDLSAITKVGGNHLQDIRHMFPKIKLSTFITWFSCRIMSYMAKYGSYSQGHQA